MISLRDLVIVGSGPAGLATAIAARNCGLDYQVLEKGVLVNSLFHFPRSMVFFTTPELLEIGGLPFTTPYEKPTRIEALRYYRRVTDTYQLSIAFDEEVLSIELEEPRGDGTSAFAIETGSKQGTRRRHRARFVVLAIGCYDRPNMLGIPGEELPHVSHYYVEAHPCYRKRVVVVGGKNSAAEASLDLYRSGAHVTLVHRHSQLGDAIKYWVRPDIENRIREGSIAARFNTRVLEIRPTFVLVERAGEREEIPAECVLLLTGYHPDVDLLSRAGVRVDGGACVPEHDPATLETNVPGLYLAGSVVTGKEANKIFIENGRFHGNTVVAEIRRRLSDRNSA